MTLPASVPFQLPEIKAELGESLKVADPARDDLIERIAIAATAAVETRLGYRVVQAPYIDTYDAHGTTILLLNNPPADLTHVYEDINRVFDSTTELDLGVDFLADYWQLGGGPGTGCRLLRRLNGNWPDQPQCVRVEYQGGWPLASVPGDIKRAIFLTAARLRDLKTGALGKSLVSLPGAGSVRYEDSNAGITTSIPNEARELLDRYAWRLDVKY